MSPRRCSDGRPNQQCSVVDVAMRRAGCGFGAASEISRVLHVLGVVLWICGVANVTTVLLPATKRMRTSEDRIMFFETVERGFALQARITTLVTGVSGLYLLYKFDLW